MKLVSHLKRNLFGVSELSVLMEKRGFPYDNDIVKDRLETIGRKFLFGYHHSLYDLGETSLLDKLKTVEIENQGFSFEGAAMGLALLDTLSFSKKSRFIGFMNGAGNSHTYMMYVGAGWAYAKLPVNVESKMNKFDPLLKWLILDGYGFCNAYFNTKKYVLNAKMPVLSEYGMHAFYQGLGRCLWFTEGSNAERIAHRISCFPPEYFGDLWAGIGLASAYAGGVDKAVLIRIRELGKEYILNIGQGAAFASKTRIRAGNLVPHTDMACMIYCDIAANKAAKITDDSLIGLNLASGGKTPAYETWRRNISNHLSELINIPTMQS